jgi:hypothetical protein
VQAVNQIVDRCGWCGVQTALNEVARSTKEFVDTEYGNVETKSWVVYECVSCNRPTLREEWFSDIHGEAIPETLLPTGERDNSALPRTVAKAWQAALAVRHVEPNAFAVLVGRTLEVICNEEGATGATLQQKLHTLVSAGRLPGPIAQMSTQLRQIRNLGAHASSDEVTSTDVPVIFEFADAILEYLYRAPAKIAAVQARLAKAP